jgi:hypothetical protein
MKPTLRDSVAPDLVSGVRLHPGEAAARQARASGATLRGSHGRAILILLCVLALLALRLPAAASADLNVAGLVVDYGDGRMSYAWVPFAEDEISGMELLQRSGLDIVTVGFGGLGEGVCQIETTGCPVSECRARLCQTSDPESPFWQYVQETEPGVWTPYALGANASKVRDGDIEGWTWSGKSPQLPALSLDDVATRAGGDPAALKDASGAVPAAVRTEGGSADDGGASTAIIGGSIAVGLVALLAGFAIWRSRSVTAGTS